MAEQITGRYFSGVHEGYLSHDRSKDLAEAVGAYNLGHYLNCKLAEPEQGVKHWHTKYSAGFHSRFNKKRNDKHVDLTHAAGGKKALMAGIRS